ncbi:MAG: hypothetical protein NTW19_25095 [Planctomycetota bacterium]|nr:hypothetical protein [Planctomycetota bacterium]
MVHATLLYPTGYRDTSVLAVERAVPAEVTLGQPFSYTINVANISKNNLSDVVVSDRCAATFKLASSAPEPAGKEGGILRWNLGNIAPGQTKSIKVSGAASEIGSLSSCVGVTYNETACIDIKVTQPKLALVASAPAQVLKCEPIPVRYIVTNGGTGAAKNVVLDNILPEGLETDKGLRSVAYKVESLPAGTSQTFDVVLRATKTGKFESKPEATAAGELKAASAYATTVVEPVLAIKKTGPAKIFIGHKIAYQIEVTNTGDGEARQTMVNDVVPAGTKVLAATEGAVATPEKVTWNLGTLKPKESKKVVLELQPSVQGEVENTATASAACATAVSASVKTAVQGIPALLLEVVDNPDPVEVNGEVVYTIEVTNQGSATATNVKISGIFEDTMQYVSSTGPTAGTLDAKTLTFKPLPTLAPKAKAVWNVRVKAIKAGDVRFKTVMIADQLQRTVEETEATNFYE